MRIIYSNCLSIKLFELKIAIEMQFPFKNFQLECI